MKVLSSTLLPGDNFLRSRSRSRLAYRCPFVVFPSCHHRKQPIRRLGSGLLSVALSAVAFEHFFLWRTFPPTHESATFLRFAVFLIATVPITALMEIKRRVEESSTRAQEALRLSRSDLAHVNRVTTMGELTASSTHELYQPIAAAVTDASTCLRWLRRDHPDVEEAREAASRMAKRCQSHCGNHQPDPRAFQEGHSATGVG